MDNYIKEKDIKSKCTLGTTYSKGITLFETEAISNLSMLVEGENVVEVSGVVEGSGVNTYDVSFSLKCEADKGTITNYKCQCEAYKTYGGVCKHLVAAMMEFNYQMEYDDVYQLVHDSDKNDIIDILSSDAFRFLSGSNQGKTISSSTQPTEYNDDTLPLMKEISTTSGRGYVTAAPPKATTKGLMDAMSAVMFKEHTRFCMEYIEGDVDLELILHIEYKTEYIDFRIGKKQMYVMKNIRKFLDNVRNQKFAKYGKNLEFVHTQSAFTKEAQNIINILLKIKSLEKNDSYAYYYSSNYDGVRTLYIDAVVLDDIMKMYAGKKIYVESEFDTTKKYVDVVQENPYLPLVLEGYKNRDCVRMQFPKIMVLEGVNNLYVYWESKIYICSEDYCANMKEMLFLMMKNYPKSQRKDMFYYGRENNDIVQELCEKDYISFCTTLLPILEKYMDVRIKDIDFSKYAIEEGVFELYFDMLNEQEIICLAKGKYGDREHNLIKQAAIDETYRDIRSEYELRTLLEEYMPEKTDDNKHYLLCQDDDRLAALVCDGINQMEYLADIYLSDSFKKIRVVKNTSVVTGLSIKGNLLNVSWDLEGMSQDELFEILDSYRKKKKFHRMKNGELLSLTDSGIDILADMQDSLQFSKAQLKAGMAEVPLYRTLYLDSLMRENAHKIKTVRDEQFEKLIEKFDNVKHKQYEIPKDVTALLRPYQMEGFRWASSLAELGFGGILADDMGLGKTLQMIAFLCSDKKSTHLVVCPASLVYNWEAEFNKFAPNIKILVSAGTLAERQKMLSHMQEYDVVITSYDLLKRDIELYADMSFGCQVIDEAQYIKNPGTQVTKAVKSIKSTTRFALTGTPIENRLSELWSIFEYLMPGYLYSYKKFKEVFEESILLESKESENTALKRLHSMIQPFFIRRLKTDVLKELPDKMEKIVYSKFSKEQEKIYRAVEKNLVMSLRQKSSQEFNENKLQILAELTKLRQICCDPSLLYDDYKESSAKLDACVEILENAIEGGHRVLLFSQFTSMLDIIAEKLKEQKINYYMITGSTSKTKRRRLVEQFQNKQAEVFLISLKAGGTGLNLTAADMVIHYDPWWNVAAQNQATDRAHRIGQENIVTVIKLIARDTIEERILKLQEQKKDLADKIISEEGMNLSAMTKDELMNLFKEL